MSFPPLQVTMIPFSVWKEKVMSDSVIPLSENLTPFPPPPSDCDSFWGMRGYGGIRPCDPCSLSPFSPLHVTVIPCDVWGGYGGVRPCYPLYTPHSRQLSHHQNNPTRTAVSSSPNMPTGFSTLSKSAISALTAGHDWIQKAILHWKFTIWPFQENILKEKPYLVPSLR